MKLFVYLVLSVGLAFVAACGSARAMPVNSNSNEVPLLSTPIPADVTNEPVMPSVADTPSPAAQKMADLSRENLSRILKISVDQILTAEVKPVIWPDAGLGCPKAGVAYIQVLTPGFLVLLEADGQRYLYHTDENEIVILCKESDLPMFPVTPGEIDDGQPWMPVD
jgi:hypothetical protein